MDKCLVAKLGYVDAVYAPEKKLPGRAGENFGQ